MDSSFLFSFMRNDQAIERLTSFLECSFFLPEAPWKKEFLDLRLYSRWTVLELISRLYDCPFDCADDIIEKFIFEMDMLKSQTNSEKLSNICSIASSTAESILFIL